MISYLSVKNIALIQELNVDFKKGLNILSGETGAGKSIIIDSINFVLGDRADRSLIRYGEKTAKVEVVFDEIKNYNEISDMLKEADIESDDETIIISRTMTQDKSECRINRKIVNLSLLRKVVSLLVDTHSQNEHQTLLKTSSQLRILDNFRPEIGEMIANYKNILSDYYKILDNLSQFPSPDERERQLDILSFQISEIEKADLQPDEEDELKTKRSLFYNSQKIVSSLQSAYGSLSGENGLGGISAVRSAISSLKSISQFDNSIDSLIERLESSVIDMDDISETIYDKLQEGDISSVNIDKIESRLDQIRLLKKKYGKTYEEILTFYDNALKKSELLSDSQAAIEKLSKEKELLEAKLISSATDIHNKRIEVAKEFCNAIMTNLNELGMKNSVFEINFRFNEDNILDNLNQNGADEIEFMLSPNLGEPVKPLAKIASGGEMSRFMLAIKNVIAEIDDVDTLIFDEVDTGISGAIALVVAKKLYNISKIRQVIAITHLPQLASMGDVNFLIEKNVIGEKTLTSLKELNEEDTYKEIMRLSGAVDSSDIGLSNAKELKNRADNYKKSVL